MLNVFLGYACNFSCPYCLQAPGGGQPRRNRQAVSPFVEKIVPYLQNNDINEIAYWGGEPLLYWSQIEAVHEGLLNAGARFKFVKIITNGALLEDHHVEALNRWGAYVVISSHQDEGDPHWQQVARLQHSSVSFLFTHQDLYAWPWLQVLDALEQRWGRPFFPYGHWVRATPGCDPGFYLTHGDLDRHIPHLRELAKRRLKGERHARSLFEGHLRDWRRDLVTGGDGIPLCHGNHHISVDLAGNRYGCHHSASDEMRTGSIFDSQTPATEGALDRIERFIGNAECQSCPIRSWCRGN
ncbi:MAG: 4Fe-4S cluster-binding domain-containing protein, partial [Chloroflexi bacterium]|nr:4Fe-4S cluster-binding domain-containing protein [Chloroflexota bacterium]